MRTRHTFLAGALIALTASAHFAAQAGAPVDRDAILGRQMTNPPKTTSAVAGKAIFEKACAPCHRFGAMGRDVGPDLTTVSARFKKKDILESVLFPSKIISDQYQSVLFQLADGSVINGLVVRETPAAVQVRTADDPDHPKTYATSQIQNRRDSTVSFMPEGLADKMSAQELANLAAFLLAGAK